MAKKNTHSVSIARDRERRTGWVGIDEPRVLLKQGYDEWYRVVGYGCPERNQFYVDEHGAIMRAARSMVYSFLLVEPVRRIELATTHRYEVRHKHA